MQNEVLKQHNLDCVLKTANELFLVQGIENTTKEMLARTSGISRSSLDRYFKNKADCVYQVADWSAKNIRSSYAQQISRFTDQTHTGIEQLQMYLEFTRDLLCECPQLFVLGVECRAFFYRNYPDYETQCDKVRQIFGSSLFVKKILDRGIADGSIRSDLHTESEAAIFRESHLGFLASIALASNGEGTCPVELIHRYILQKIQQYRRI